jgi:hypothetical protein
LLGPYFDGWDDFASWAAGAADTAKSLWKRESVELFGDLKFLGGVSILLDAAHEYRTHPKDSSSILGDTGAVEAKLFLAGVAPWLAIGAVLVDPILKAKHRQGIMDVAGDAGRAAVQQFLKEFPTDMKALAWLVSYASSQNPQIGSPTSSNPRRAAPTHGSAHSAQSSANLPQFTYQPRADWSELDKAIAQGDADWRQK